jgi:hypothetical protein
MHGDIYWSRKTWDDCGRSVVCLHEVHVIWLVVA